jgi:DNA ligase (NAD+)
MSIETITKQLLSCDTRSVRTLISAHTLSVLHETKLYLDDLYYNTDESSVSDTNYDVLKEYLTIKDPDWQPPIGCKIRANENRTVLPFWLGSATKITPSDGDVLDRWISNESTCQSNTVIVSDKLDGVSGMLSISKNGNVKLYTRGDGVEGADISFFLQFMNLPEMTGLEGLTIRGELVVSKKVFEGTYMRKDTDKSKMRNGHKTYRAARSMVTGLIGGRTLRQGVSDIRFVAYEMVSDSAQSLSNQIKFLNEMGFETVRNNSVDISDITTEFLVEIHNDFKKNSKYDIDGIVCVSDRPYDRNTKGNPSYMFAYKVASETEIKTTRVTNVVWSISKWMQLIPVVHVEPVDVTGATIRKISGANAGLLKSRGIGPGAVVRVTRSNEVIPYIVEVVIPVDKFPEPPMECKWDKNRVHLISTEITGDAVKSSSIKLCAGFFSKLGIKFVSIMTVTKLFDSGFSDLISIIKATKEDLIASGAFKEKSADRIVSNITDGLNGVEIGVLLGSCGVFGNGVGRSRMESLLRDIPDLLTIPDNQILAKVLEVDGFSSIMAKKVHSHIDVARKFMDCIGPYVILKNVERSGNDLVGKKFAMSGFRDKELEAKLAARGATITSSVSKKTTALIVSSMDVTGKISKAMENGVNIYERKAFNDKYF